MPTEDQIKNIFEHVTEIKDFADASESRMLRGYGTLDDLKIMIEMARRTYNLCQDIIVENTKQ